MVHVHRLAKAANRAARKHYGKNNEHKNRQEEDSFSVRISKADRILCFHWAKKTQGIKEWEEINMLEQRKSNPIFLPQII